MKVIELLKSKEWSGKVIDCVLRFALSFALALAQVFGGYAPLALGMIGASGAGLRGVSALIGASAGAVLFLPFSHALRTFAAGVLIFTANNAFFDLKLYKKRAFLPLLCAGMMFSVEFVYVLRDGVGEAANCLMALLLCALGAMSGRALLSTGGKEKEDHPYAPLFILLGVLMAASSFETADGFAPGRILSMLAVLLFAFERGSAFAIPAALCIGLGMDLGAGGRQLCPRGVICVFRGAGERHSAGQPRGLGAVVCAEHSVLCPADERARGACAALRGAGGDAVIPADPVAVPARKAPLQRRGRAGGRRRAQKDRGLCRGAA